MATLVCFWEVTFIGAVVVPALKQSITSPFHPSSSSSTYFLRLSSIVVSSLMPVSCDAQVYDSLEAQLCVATPTHGHDSPVASFSGKPQPLPHYALSARPRKSLSTHGRVHDEWCWMHDHIDPTILSSHSSLSFRIFRPVK